MRIFRTAALCGLVLALFGLGRTPAVGGETGHPVSSHPMIGEHAPSFELAEADGGSLSLEALQGRYVVLHFGASW